MNHNEWFRKTINLVESKHSTPSMVFTPNMRNKDKTAIAGTAVITGRSLGSMTVAMGYKITIPIVTVSVYCGPEKQHQKSHGLINAYIKVDTPSDPNVEVLEIHLKRVVQLVSTVLIQAGLAQHADLGILDHSEGSPFEGSFNQLDFVKLPMVSKGIADELIPFCKGSK